MDFARLLFSVTRMGGSVHVTGDAPESPELALAMVRGVGAYVGMGGPEEPLEGN
jgi:hypothetical protein